VFVHGYLLSQGRFITIDFPGAVNTIASSINPAGDIILGGYDTLQPEGWTLRHGFLLRIGKH
jgi:hypothetical protein